MTDNDAMNIAKLYQNNIVEKGEFKTLQEKAKQVPVKEEYEQVYSNPVYSIPLYKFVYNDSVITTHHWEWGSMKVKDEVGVLLPVNAG